MLDRNQARKTDPGGVKQTFRRISSVTERSLHVHIEAHMCEKSGVIEDFQTFKQHASA